MRRQAKRATNFYYVSQQQVSELRQTAATGHWSCPAVHLGTTLILFQSPFISLSSQCTEFDRIYIPAIEGAVFSVCVSAMSGCECLIGNYQQQQVHQQIKKEK